MGVDPIAKLQSLPVSFEVVPNMDGVALKLKGAMQHSDATRRSAPPLIAVFVLCVLLGQGFPPSIVVPLLLLLVPIWFVVTSAVRSETVTALRVTHGAIEWDGNKVPWSRVRALSDRQDPHYGRTLVLGLNDGSELIASMSSHNAADQHRLVMAFKALWAEVHDDPDDAAAVKRQAASLKQRQ